MKAGVYCGHLRTLGGGEQYSLAVARWLLSLGHQVDVLGPPGTTLEEAEQRLRIRLPGARLVSLASDFPDCEPEATERSAEYDLFFNLTYATGARSKARRSVLVIHFPLPPAPLPDLTGTALARWTRAARRQPGCLHHPHGVHGPEPGGRWTEGEAVYLARARTGHRATARVVLGAPRPRGLPAAEAAFLLDGTEVRRRRLPRAGRVTVRLRDVRSTDAEHRRLSIVTETFNPARQGLSGDDRDLGAFIRRASFGRTELGADQAEYGCRLHFLDSYRHIVANSRYTARWARRLWATRASVVFPPVRPPEAPPEGRRSPSVVVLGRFFGGYYSKKQLELVRAFTGLCDGGFAGWTLHLLGNNDDAEYLDRVREAASGYPVEIHADAPGPVVEEHLRQASLAWHATGWGEDPSRHPERFEHFGIGVVEAMGAGVVPVVLGVGGPAEVVRHGRDGLLWSPSDGPGRATEDLVANPAALRRLAAGARARAAHFSPQAFEARLSRLLGTAARP